MLIVINMFYHHPHICGSAYAVWKRLVSGRKCGLCGIHKLSHKYGYDKAIFFSASAHGDISIANEIIQREFNCPLYIRDPYWAMTLAVIHGKFAMVKWLYHHGFKPDDNTFCFAIHTEHFRIAKWLYKIGCDPTTNTNEAIRYCKSLKIAQWLYSIGCDPTANNNEAIVNAAAFGRLQIVKWLYSIGCDVSVNHYAPIRTAKIHGHRKVYDFLSNKTGIFF